jgi:hypothetical protein
MDEFKSNVPGTFVRQVNRKAVYFSLLAVIAVAAVAGILLAYNGTATVSAARQTSTVVDQQMLAAAVDLKSAGGFAVYAERGSSLERVKGQVFDGRTEAVGAEAVRRDLRSSMNYIKQLPCTDVQGSDLGGRSFTPGVYCVSSARLAGEMALSAGGDSSALFVFKVRGTFTADDNARISLSDGARSGNVYFVATEGARVGTGADFRAHLIANNDVTIGSGTRVGGRVVSTAGTVSAAGAELSAEAGTLQICKEVIFPDNTAAAEADTFTNRIFTFTVAGITVTVPAGQCSAPFTVPSGIQTIQEANTGTWTNMTGTWTGGFILDHVDTLTNLSNSSVVGINAPLRQVIVNIGDPGALLSIRVFDRPAITGVIELCKLGAAGDPDIAGVFRFTIQGLTVPAASGSVGNSALQVFLAPLGGCSGPITVQIPTAFPFPNSATFLVSELGPALAAAAGPGAPTGYELIGVTSDPAGRVSPVNFNARLNANGTVTNGANVGGGVVTALVVRTSPGPGGTASDPNDATDETRLFFTNRSLPGLVKVCKIAGPGIDLNTPFTFEVRGTNGAGAAITRFVTVLAGPAPQGGNCNIVREDNGVETRFRVGTNVVVRELGPTTITNAAGETGDVRISRIRGTRQAPNGTFEPAPFPAGPVTVNGVTTNPNPDITPNAAAGDVSADLGRAVLQVRREEIAFEFTNILFRPTVLKVCKIAGNGVAQGTVFNFTVTRDNVGGLLPSFTTTVAVAAGPGGAGQNGFCQIVDPGAAANGGGNGLVGGAFNIGESITVTEAASAGTGVTAITSPTGAVTATLAARRADLVLVGPTTLVSFTNSVATGAEAVRFDFDGDRKSDASIFSPASARWTFASTRYNDERSRSFGVSTDILVPADYDGDGITDVAVFRPSNGRWYLNGSTQIYREFDWGQAGDIPQAGDFDGDGIADLTVFRPSNGMWYMKRSAEGFAIFQFGVSTDKPVAADYDGDKKMDAAVFRNGTWFIAGSSTGFVVRNFGIATDRAVPADYDGDGKADIAVYRGGTWFISGTRGPSFDIYQHGTENDIPVPADYDGDGRTDLAVFRASEGKWLIRRSSQRDGASEMSTINLGGASDVAIPGL